jgi:ribose-phosphate pyrophosphokinase
MAINNYPDGSSYAEETPKKEFTFRINTYQDLWHLNQIVDAQNNMGVKPNVLIPWLIDAQADRRFESNQSSGLKLVCKFLNSMKAKFTIFHPHNSEVVEALIKNVEIIDNGSFVKTVLGRLITDSKSLFLDNLVLLFPDGGAYKWGVKLADNINWEGDVIAAAKNRKFVNGKSTLIQQLPDYDFTGKDVIIIDDCAIYGGTHIGLSKLLKERGCNNLYLAVSHLTVQNFENNNLFESFNKIFTTNSKYNCYYVRKDSSRGVAPKNLEIINIF